MATFKRILDRITKAIEQFNKKIPATQRAMLDALEDELRRLDVADGRIKPTVSNIKVVASIKSKMLRLIVTDEYTAELKQFIQAFRDITTLQNQYWKSVESTFKPRSILKQIRQQAISDTVAKLGESGIGTNIGNSIADMLNQNITTGGSYKDLLGQLRGMVMDTPEGDGLFNRYAKQVTVDSINQYNANYTRIVSSDLGYQWFAYDGADIKTTRPFCDAMTDFRYFHITEIPRLLRAEDLYYVKDGKRLKVPIYDKTELPHGMIAGTNPENFFVRRGGFSCGHQIRPVSETLIKRQAPEIFNRVTQTAAYKNYNSIT